MPVFPCCTHVSSMMRCVIVGHFRTPTNPWFYVRAHHDPEIFFFQNCFYKHVSYYKWQGRCKPIWVPAVWLLQPSPPPHTPPPGPPNSHVGPKITKDLNGFTYEKYIIHFSSYYTYVTSVMRYSWHFGNPAWIQQPGWCAHVRPMKIDLCAQEQINPWAQAQINPWSQVLIDPWAQAHIDPWAQSPINPGAKWAYRWWWSMNSDADWLLNLVILWSILNASVLVNDWVYFW